MLGRRRSQSNHTEWMLVQLFVEEQHEVSFGNFEAVFAAVVLPSLAGDRMQHGWEVIKGSS